ncbi:unnamed protein product, partial [Medioppia subpectinata]
NRTLKIDPDFGDSWAYAYKFEVLHGSQEQQEDIKKRCCAVEPRHGDNWCRVSKDVSNWRLTTEEILERTANLLPIPT